MFYYTATVAPLVSFLTTGAVNGYPSFAERIPNGYSVPNPEPQGGVWAGVGHLRAGGGGALNPFGESFRDQGYEWTVELCELDSDNDGRSNGVELGDPNCVWLEGEEAEGPATSHPGFVDEPLDPSELANLESCSDYIAPEDEVSLQVEFTDTVQLDNTRTQYKCEQKEVQAPSPNHELYHIIKSEVMLSNANVLHHMIIYACVGGETSSDGNRVGQGAYDCNGFEMNCGTLGGWAIGGKPECEPENVGFEIDFSSEAKFVVKIEAHYDNSSGQSQQDQSGIRFYMTPTLRPLRASAVVTGMAHLSRQFEIPSQQEQYTLVNICPSTATAQLSEPIYVYSWLPHMHLYGRQLVTEHYRCGQKVGEIGRINSFEFDNQQSYDFATPIKILPGDALYTKCTYDTMGTTETVLGGEETTDEMCLNFLNYYPHLGNTFQACMSFEDGIIVSDPELVDTAIGKYLSTASFVLVSQEPDPSSLVRTFNPDPEQNIAACCLPTNTCEQDYFGIAGTGDACAQDPDCTDGLFCNGGICGSEQPTSMPTPKPTASLLTASPNPNPTSLTALPTTNPMAEDTQPSPSESPNNPTSTIVETPQVTSSSICHTMSKLVLACFGALGFV